MPKVILKSKKLALLEQVPVLQEKPKTILKLKKKLPVPPPPAAGAHLTKAMEAFEAIREFCSITGKPIPEDCIKWYQEELISEKKEYDEFWNRCLVTKVAIECSFRGDDEWTTELAINAARQKVKAMPIREEDIGPMPAHGTGEFWAWCHKRKKLKEQKEAAIVAAGGTLPEKKIKVKKIKQVSP